MLRIIVLTGALAFTHVASGQSDLVAWWRADGDARDSAGQNHGTLVGGVTFVPGMCGQAFNVVGPGYVEIPESPAIDFGPGGSYSIVLWAYRTAETGYFHLMGKRNGCGGGYNFIQVVADQPNEISAVPLDQWCMIALVADGPAQHQLDFVVNGVVISELSWTLPTAQNDATWRLGTSGTCAGFEGYLDEVMIFNRALAVAELRAMYAHPCQPPPRGDLNCDGAVNFRDIDPFVLALSDPAGYQATFPNCNILKGDIDGNGFVDFNDINPFVALLAGG